MLLGRGARAPRRRPGSEGIRTFPRPFREARLRAYIVGQHRARRPLASILTDPYIGRCGSESLNWKVMEDPRTIEALERDYRA
jgi:hypothetical protein